VEVRILQRFEIGRQISLMGYPIALKLKNRRPIDRLLMSMALYVHSLIEFFGFVPIDYLPASTARRKQILKTVLSQKMNAAPIKFRWNRR
jgi:hypothetical protein